MSEAAVARGGEPRLTGAVDTLLASYGVMNRRPGIVLSPVLLDLFSRIGRECRRSARATLGPSRRRVAALESFEPNSRAEPWIVVLIMIIVLGIYQMWASLATRAPWGLAPGMVGNTYIASRLTSASTLFYREGVRAPPCGRDLTPSGEV